MRFIKVRQQLMSFGVMIVLGVGGGFVGRAIGKTRSKPVTVAIVGAERFGGALPAPDRVVWKQSATDEASLRAQVTACWRS